MRRFGHKYGAQRSKILGQSFASKLEANQFLWLKACEQAGEIELLQCQDQVELALAGVIYKPDFRIFDKRLNEEVYVEAKGFPTPEWRIKRRLWTIWGPGRLRVYHQVGRLGEEIVPKPPVCPHCGKEWK